MTDIVSHIVTIGFGLLLFFAVLYELVMTFKRKKEEFVTAKSPPWRIKGDEVAFTSSEDLFNSPEGKKMLESASYIKISKGYDKACAGSGSDYSGIYERTKDGMIKVADIDGVPVNRGQPGKRTQEASDTLTVENIETRLCNELKRTEVWVNDQNHSMRIAESQWEKRFGPTNFITKALEQGQIAEYEVRLPSGLLVGYWAYGSYDLSLPYPYDLNWRTT